MQNNVTDLSQKLQRSLDNNYNVIDMPAVIEIISTLEKTAVTKELLETTRLGKSINELRRRTTNDSLAKRAKELLKKWRKSILPNANGQIKAISNNSTTAVEQRSESPADIITTTTTSSSSSSNLTPIISSHNKSRKRAAPTPEPAHTHPPKRPLSMNGQSRELDFSDNSNCSIKDFQSKKPSDVIFINSDSNSSLPDQNEVSVGSFNDTLDAVDSSSMTSGIPKKRGRKKGSKNHKNLVIAAEESFTNKMAVSRNSKVKTTQELLADLQNRTVVTKQDIELRAAQLTESLSRIDQKLNPQKQINKNCTPMRNTNTEKHWPQQQQLRNTPEVVVLLQSDDEIVDVVGTDPPQLSSVPSSSSSSSLLSAIIKSEQAAISMSTTTTTSHHEPLTISGLLAQLPPIDLSILQTPAEVPVCECPLPPVHEVTLPPDKITVQIVSSEPKEKSLFCPSPLGFDTPSPPPALSPTPPPPPLIEDSNIVCCAKSYLRNKYYLDVIPEDRLDELHSRCLQHVNGNLGVPDEDAGLTDHHQQQHTVPHDIVPNMTTERLGKGLSFGHTRAPSENFKKYSISISEQQEPEQQQHPEQQDVYHNTTQRTDILQHTPAGGDSECFREWHQTLDVLSYNGETLRILPYVIID